ncbi:MAG: HEAT repeat domain-containing protein [Planctomycetota bacterium]|jgi:DNA-binding NarL/FixJ family response regulator
MAKLVAKSLLGVVVACVASGVLSAQQDPKEIFDEAVKQLRLNNKAGALEKFREVTKLDPTNAQAWKLWEVTDKDIWEELLFNDEKEIRQIAQFLMARAKVARKTMSRDEAAIKGLAAQACSAKYTDRVKARNTLRADHGEFAVPALLQYLGNIDDENGQGYATLALRDLGRSATPALIEALKSDNATLRVNTVGVLNLLGDHRAKAALAGLVANDDQEAVREVARNALTRMNVGASASPKALHMIAAHDYLTGKGELDADPSEVIWTLKDGKLVHTDISALVYFEELAKRNAEAALNMDPADPVAQTLVTRCYLAQIATINAAVAVNDASGVALQAVVPSLKLVAMASGPAILRRALNDSIRDRQPAVAIAAIRALGETEGKDDLENSPLVAMLDRDNKAVAYAAALALSKAARGSTVPAAHKVIQILAEAVTEESVLNIEVVGDTPDFKKAPKEASGTRGQAVDASARGKDAANKVLTYANVDVLVINETLPDMIPATLIGLVRNNERTKDIKILIVAADTDKATEQYGDKIQGVIQGPLTGEALDKAIAAAVQGIDLGPNRKEAERIAKAASEALHTLAADRVNVSDALANLAGQLNRQDYIARPAAKALGEAGSEPQLAALIAAIKGSGSLELKIDCADSLGQILGRLLEIDQDTFAAMRAVAVDAAADMRLRHAVVTALGRAKLLPGDKLELIKILQTVAVSKGDSGSEEGN